MAIRPIPVVEAYRSQTGRTLTELSEEHSTLVAFLRHSGCSFCREMLAHLSNARVAIEQVSTRLALVHMMPDFQAASLFAKYGLQDVPRFSDPDQNLYRAFGVPTGTISQVLGPRVWWQGFKTIFLNGYLPGRPSGDVFQLPGVFLLDHGAIVREHRFETSADHVDFVDLASCPLGASMPSDEGSV